MKIIISEHALEMIRKAAKNNLGKIPTICVFKGGCAGTMLGITFLESDKDSEVIKVGDVLMAVSKETMEITDDISIDVKNGILPELIIRNNLAKVKCKCGKSFKI